VDRGVYTIGGEFCLDEVIRYEHLERDLEIVCERLSRPFEIQRLPRLKSGIRRRDVLLEDLYSREGAELVARAFEFELERFSCRSPYHNA